MTDRELLELAAKAAGYDTSHSWNKFRLALDPPLDSLCIDGVSTAWNPLTNDGDALRLAVKLRIDINEAQDWYYGDAAFDADPYAATRCAIVRAAAEIGKAMP